MIQNAKRASLIAFPTFCLAASLVAGVFFTNDAYAVTSAEKQAEANEIAYNIDALQTRLNEAYAQYDEAVARRDEAQANADDAKKRAEEATARIDELQGILNTRAKDMYKSGGTVQYLDVVLGSNSFEEFVTSWDAANAVAGADADLIKESKDLKEEAVSAQKEFEEQTAAAEEEVTAAELAAADIESTRAVMQEQLARVNQEVVELQAKEEAERIAQEEAERRKQAAEEAARNSSLGNEDNESEGAEASSDESSTDEGDSTADSDAEKSSEEAAEVETQAATTEDDSDTGEAAEPAAEEAEPAAADTGDVSTTISGWVNPIPSMYGVTNEFAWAGAWDGQYHNGIDLGAAMGDPILAAGPGTVSYVGDYGSGGNAVKINHGNGVVTIYMHMNDFSVSTGAEVKAGDEVGHVGMTGYTTGPHLHFQIEIDGTPVNPRNYYSF